MVTETKASSIGLVVQTRLISGTYVDLWRVKDYLSVSLFDSETLDAKIRSQAINATDKVNTFLGKTVAFTEAELMTTQFGGVVDASSQLTACLVQKNPQGAAMNYTEDTVADCESAFETLTQWALNNGLEIPNEETKTGHPLTELIYITNDSTAVI
jgi:hypothetical protein